MMLEAWETCRSTGCGMIKKGLLAACRWDQEAGSSNQRQRAGLRGGSIRFQGVKSRHT